MATVLEEYAPDDERLRARSGDDAELELRLESAPTALVGAERPLGVVLDEMLEAVGREKTDEGLNPGRTEEP